jgi:hypothetical protein
MDATLSRRDTVSEGVLRMRTRTRTKVTVQNISIECLRSILTAFSLDIFWIFLENEFSHT